MAWLAQCLGQCDNYPVIVVDNGSTDGTVAFIEENFPKVQVLVQKTNLGFGQANNLGIKKALEDGADSVFLLNQDAYLEKRCVESLIAVQEQNPQYGVLSPVHFNGIGTALDEKFLLYLRRYEVDELLLFDAFSAQFGTAYPIDFVNAAAWLISKSCLEVVGGFDPLFFHYGEDRNYCQRVAYHEFKVGIVPAGIVFHDRESRAEQPMVKFSERYYKEYERYLKVDWADVNLQDYSRKIDARIRYLKSKCLRYFLGFNFKMGKDAYRKKQLLQQLKAEILKSRNQNATKAMSYLQ